MGNTRIWVAAIGGVIVGSALSEYAHSGNGFLTGPVILFALAISIVGVLGSAFLLVIGRRSQVVRALLGFSIAMLATLILLPLIWPYANPSGPVPLSQSRAGWMDCLGLRGRG